MKIRLTVLSLVTVSLAITAALAQDAVTVVKSDVIPWKSHPIFKGAQNAIVLGDPTKTVPILQRNKFPPGFNIPPHTHPYDEVITILGGTLGFGVGDKFDKEKGQLLAAGSVMTIKAGQSHYVWTAGDEATIQINFVGPGGIGFPNPADDPRKK